MPWPHPLGLMPILLTVPAAPIIYNTFESFIEVTISIQDHETRSLAPPAVLGAS